MNILVIINYVIVIFNLGLILSFISIKRKDVKQIKKMNNELEKKSLYYQIVNIWFFQEQRGNDLISYMKEKNYANVAIYGMTELGEHLYYELVQGGINVVCVIDQSPYVLGEFRLIKTTDPIPDVDIVIVTAEYYIEDIERELKKRTDAKIIALSTLLGNAFRMNW